MFGKVWDWIKAHPYMSIGLGVGVFVLIYLWSARSQANAQAQAQAASQAGTGAPSDTIQAMEIQAGAQLQAAQISAQATTAAYQAQLQAAQMQLQAQQNANNSQNQAALTLGLAQAGESTASILQLLGAQPGQTTISTTIVPTTTTVSTATGTPNQTPAPINPAPVQQLPAATTPVQNAADTQTQLAYMYVTPSTDVQMANDANLYEQDVTGTVAGGGSYTVNNTYYATPQATASLAGILGTQAVVSPSVVGASGGPLFNPPTNDVITPSGTVDAGQMLSELQNTAPGEWSTILGGYGIQDTASVNAQLTQLFGANQAIPSSASGVSMTHTATS